MSATSVSFPALDDLHALLDQRTVEILERRRGAAVVKRRGWIVRRALLGADLVGLTLAFLVAQQIHAAGMGGGNHLDRVGEIVLFLLTLPGWVLVAKLYGLYDKDEERADHSTVDDLVGVFPFPSPVTEEEVERSALRDKSPVTV